MRLMKFGLVFISLFIVLMVVTNARPLYESSTLHTDRNIKNGEYMFYAAGCVSCHHSPESKQRLSGGVELDTPFGVLVTPNISPSMTHGIGSWSSEDFLNAVKAGVSPDKKHYYPGFPYTRYAGLSNQDVLDIKAYIFSLEPVNESAGQHRMFFPFNIRRAISFWKFANFDTTAFVPDSTKSALVNRGEYLVEHVAHCGECHTPRNLVLGLDKDNPFGGSVGFDGIEIPALIPEFLQAMGEKAVVEGVLVNAQRLNGKPITQNKMLEVIKTTRQMTKYDRRATYAYLSGRKD